MVHLETQRDSETLRHSTDANTYLKSTQFLQHANYTQSVSLQTNEHTESRHTDRSQIFTSTIDLHLQITKQTKTFDMSPVVKS